MSNYTASLPSWVAGDDKEIDFKYTLDGAGAYYITDVYVAFKQALADSDTATGDVLFHLTTSSSGSGVITDTGSVSGFLSFTLFVAYSISLSMYALTPDWEYAVKVVSNLGKTYTPEIGTFTLLPEAIVHPH